MALEKITIRESIFMLWTVAVVSRQIGRGYSKIQDLYSLLCYSQEAWCRKKRILMDVEQQVKDWTRIIRVLSTAHSKDELDKAEFEMDQHLGPMLSAPVKQLREFYLKLLSSLKADPSVPLFTWASFEGYHKVFLEKAPDGEIVTLKKELACKIAEMVEKDVQPDICEAIKGALQWRSQEQLEKIKTAVEAGGKPRLRGRESCLFLCVPDADGKEVTVML